MTIELDSKIVAEKTFELYRDSDDCKTTNDTEH